MKKNLQQQKDLPLFRIVTAAESVVKAARRNGHSLSGDGFYATKFSAFHAEALNNLRELQEKCREVQDDRAGPALGALEGHVRAYFDPASQRDDRTRTKNETLLLLRTAIVPMLQVAPLHAPSDKFFPLEIVRNTRPYIEKVATQACGCYDQGWYDGASVMARRLLETLIIELYEAKKIDHKIKKPDGTFHYLSGLIAAMLSETTAFNLGRNSKKALPLLKDLGDQSAHNRRYTARKPDLDGVKRELRVAIEEIVHLIGFK